MDHKWYTIVGRMPDHENTLFIGQAESADVAVATFANQLYEMEGQGAERAETDNDYGIYVFTVVESDTQPRDVTRGVPVKPKRIVFTAWLKKQATRDDYVGDLARDANADSGFPQNAGHATVRDHLEKVNAFQPALDALDAAIKEYERV